MQAPAPTDVATLADADLAERVAAREATAGATDAGAAETELCRRFAPRVRSYGLRHLRSEDAAAELVQRVLLSMIVKLRQGEVRESDRIASFVLGTARNMAREMRRANARLEPLPDDGPWIVDAAPTYRFERKRVARCMGELGERERSIVTLSFFEDCTAAEISTSLGVTAGNVRVLRHRALTALRECFERRGEAA